MKHIYVDSDSVARTAALVDEQAIAGSAVSGSSGRPALDAAIRAADTAWSLAPADADARQLAERLRGARADAIAVEGMIVDVIRATGDGIPA
jgi:hypothetical protein